MSNVFQEINEQLNIQDVARHLGLNVNRAGYILCPFHHEKTPSCKLYEKNFHCFGCGAHGDTIDLVAAVRGCTKTQAVAELNNYYNLGVDLGRQSKRIKRKPKRTMSDVAQVKRLVDTLADAARELRHTEGAPESLIEWLDGVHQDMLDDDKLRLSDPAHFYEKWRSVFDEYENIRRKSTAGPDDARTANSSPGPTAERMG